MRRKPFAIVLIGLLLAIGIWVATRTEEPRAKEIALPAVNGLPTAAPTPSDKSSVSSTAAALQTSASVGLSATASPFRGVGAPSPSIAPPDAEAMIDVDKVNLMIRDYRTLAGENPVGTNAEIMSALMGGNPKQAQLGPPEGIPLNEKGELIDRWGTPYFFHQLSRDHMEIRSAGPDRIMWTEDDPVIR